MIINISQIKYNSTPEVVRALNDIKAAGGGVIHFETGEYHFFRDGALKEFFAVSNNSACDKHIAFPVLGMENVTIDGHGSLFVFHEIVFPFMVSKSKNVTIKNLVIDIGMSPLVNFTLHGFTDDGFYMDVDKSASPFYIENGAVNFKRESGVWYGKEHLLSLHAIGRHQVQYLATGKENTVNTENLPAPVMKCEVIEAPNGIYAKYRSDTPSCCKFGSETVSAIIDGGRSVDVICIDRAENINIVNVTVVRGIGMGIIGQLSKNIYIDSFATDASYHGNRSQTLTADALHFVNCDGALEIKNCKLSDIMDDAINVHGIYTEVCDFNESGLKVALKHREQHFFNPYREGDRLEIIDNNTLDIVGEYLVESAEFVQGGGTELWIKGRFTYGAEKVKNGYLIENPDRMPNLHLHHNEFKTFPHNRISGAGEILVEENRFTDCHAALLCLDLAKYWYESGRVKHLIYRNNVLNNCNVTGDMAFIMIGVNGAPNENTPRIHKCIQITGNQFLNVKGSVIKAGGVQDLLFENNIFEDTSENNSI